MALLQSPPSPPHLTFVQSQEESRAQLSPSILQRRKREVKRRARPSLRSHSELGSAGALFSSSEKRAQTLPSSPQTSMPRTQALLLNSLVIDHISKARPPPEGDAAGCGGERVQQRWRLTHAGSRQIPRLWAQHVTLGRSPAHSEAVIPHLQ